MLVRTDQVLRRFEADLAALNSPSDEDVFRAIKQVVRTLNEVNEEYDHAAYETGEREQLCDYIDKSLTETGSTSKRWPPAEASSDTRSPTNGVSGDLSRSGPGTLHEWEDST